jgi:hypothetical protein
MAQWTLLEITEEVLASMGSDEITSISDTVEASDVSKIVRACYFNIVDTLALPKSHRPFNLEASGDNNKPVLMTKPAEVKNIHWLKYDTQLLADAGVPQFTELRYQPFGDFLFEMHQLRSDDDDVESFTHTFTGGDTITFYYRNDTPPSKYTSFDDNILIFDSYDDEVDTTTLQADKSLGFGEYSFTFTMSDGFTPPLTDQQHTLLVNEAKAWAWAELKQMPHQKAEREIIRGRIKQKAAGQSIPKYQNPLDALPHFGRK